MSSIADSIMDTSSIGLETSTDKRKFAMLDWSQPIPSDVLFSNGDEVFIQHQGAQYRLRRTPDGKLILSK